LYRDVLKGRVAVAGRGRGGEVGKRLPVVLTQVEVRGLLNAMSGTMGLVAALLYGTGMCLLEGLRLWVKDVEFSRREIVVAKARGASTG
jgi:site-specific recombinase XerD